MKCVNKFYFTIEKRNTIYIVKRIMQMHMNNLGIGVHPQRRIELVKSKALAKGHSID